MTFPDRPNELVSYPAGPPAALPPQQLQIGDFLAGPEQVQVPGGTVPIAGTTWRLNDAGAQSRVIPTYAIVLAIVLIPCTGFLSLLFLLIRETRFGGLAQVEMTTQMMTLSTIVPVRDAAALTWVRHAVQQAQSWSLAGWQAQEMR